MIKLINGECLEEMKAIPDGSIDCILTDPPYGTAGGMGGNEKRYKNIASVKWDTRIDHDLLMEQCNRILRLNGRLILFSQEPYTSKIITETHNNLKFSYRLLWLKDHFANSLIVNKAPVSYFEDICCFYKEYDFLNLHPLRKYSKKVIQHVGKSIKEINSDLGHRRSEHFFYVESTQFGLCTKKNISRVN